MALLYFLLSGINPQRPGHSLFIDGAQLPLEARVGGIFTGFMAALAMFVLLGRERAIRYPRGKLAAALLAGVALLALDGTNALLHDLGRGYLYPPSNPLRYATGLLCGLALAAFALPSVASVLWLEGEDQAPLEHPAEWLAALGVLTLVWLLVVADIAPLLYPVALAHLAGTLLAFTLGNLYLLSLVRRRPWEAADWRGALRPLLTCGLLGLAELALLATLRFPGPGTSGPGGSA